MRQAQYDEIFSIMEGSFPVSEFRTYSGQKALLDNPHYRIYTEQDAGGRIIAFLAAWEFPGLRFIEHIAVSPGIRGGGTGKILMDRFLARSEVPVLLEVEPPDGEIEQRRIGFYERLGFHLNPFEYVQPPLRSGEQDLPLRIMTYPGPVGAEEFRQYREILYSEVYKRTAPGS
ncbi:GNAT family acetyltraansferase [Paenibacillus sp. FSL R7-0273]|uniref:GNAT family N-acetyltransferase n=1 Tax=Paenibacillus sp. FSL R7-0273 TaxID=1536772 RepID=UPI0004F68A4C|nr:GNAT family N-acetyltransferase [Paenibacillus sp. FSL R7-0273]AIQ45101.1 GNAT family acetyltraansferase [Paenibacillus sp. FSL R7-0273]OMF84623.1 GNAT family N-acetyltransferase [Paenibacillus sp. FSL R7-0273]